MWILPTVRSQISTITMAAFNTTVASFNVGYADFFTEHMKKLCNPVTVPEIPVEPLACANLPRSFTDSCINYSFLEEGENIEGTNNFVLKNGMLDLTVSDRSINDPRGQIQLMEVIGFLVLFLKRWHQRESNVDLMLLLLSVSFKKKLEMFRFFFCG